MDYIAYYRVSTKRQGNSGLGLKAQKEIISNFCRDGNITAEFIEVETGKNNTRIELDKAITKSNNTDARLVIAKLDRLSRNAGFIFKLKDTGVDFVCADMPELNTLTLGIFASLAQYERELISERTKAALRAKMQNEGWKAGTPKNLTDKARAKAVIVRKENARSNENNQRAFALAKSLREKGTSYQAIADELNKFGFKTSQGKSFFKNTVKRLIDTMSTLCL